MNNKISAVIITFNEERNIGRCLDSLKEIADEIVVIDSHSTDGTAAIAKSKGATFTNSKEEVLKRKQIKQKPSGFRGRHLGKN